MPEVYSPKLGCYGKTMFPQLLGLSSGTKMATGGQSWEEGSWFSLLFSEWGWH